MLTRKSTGRESGCWELPLIYERWSPGLARVVASATGITFCEHCVSSDFIETSYNLYSPVKFGGHYKRKSSDFEQLSTFRVLYHVFFLCFYVVLPRISGLYMYT